MGLDACIEARWNIHFNGQFDAYALTRKKQKTVD